ncbi:MULTISPECIES: hypothetical protein [unclassified Methanoregula]|uniref:hypothetical protein n=1 Tax=unclassified Methanoregula TaxID=2649730 RepID=UPI0009CA480D|nr:MULTISPECIES: hypothetical protein [unclassified Methanoregula]OPX65334.1 MAG: hypothetical protein A4E33_00367 [Methanoregula sp. PtaB.Bin085]OPY32243.1 MAG: hypothetical protein A4E34_02617 [Methanoregula sp. PtaU1.Bin006]
MDPFYSVPRKKSSVFHPLTVSALIILCWCIPLAAAVLAGKGHGAGIWNIFEIIALAATVLASVMYGWRTLDTNGAVLIGILPFLLVMTVIRFGTGNLPVTSHHLVNTVVYIAVLCIIGGLEGYFASRPDWKFRGIAIILAGAWIGVFLSGID